MTSQHKPIGRSTVEIVTIDDLKAGQRLDNFLITRLKGIPKSRIYRLIRKGEVRINQKRVKPQTRLQVADKVRVPPITLTQVKKALPPPSRVTQLRMDDAILYEDAGFLVLNKPAGMAVHGGSGVTLGVIEIMRQMRPQARLLELVHRLDRDTSGCLMIAKKSSVLRILHQAFRAGLVNKCYQGLCVGQWQAQQVKVTAPLHKYVLANGERRVKVSTTGKPACTYFSTLNLFKTVSFMQITLKTGRTHQIRVHAAHMGHPLAGDTKYGDEHANKSLEKFKLSRLFLHAYSLTFKHPVTAQPIKLTAPLPPELEHVLQRLQKK